MLRKDVPPIEGLNDSKQVPEAHRLALAETIKERALAWAIVDIEPSEIDECGMTACLRKAFRQAVAEIEAQGIEPEVILLDGNPLHLDPREMNVVATPAALPSRQLSLSPKCRVML